MLRCHITTNDLRLFQNDIVNSQFPGWFWQRGSDGAITSGGSFTGANLSLNDKGVDAVSGAVVTPTGRAFELEHILNLAGHGFYQVKTITNNGTAVLRHVPSYQARINDLEGLEYADATFTADTALEWSFGGWEDKVLASYITLLDDLISLGVETSSIDSDDMTFNTTLTYKALEMICMALMTEPDGLMAAKAGMWGKKYSQLMQQHSASFNANTQSVESGDWGRTS